MGVTDDLLNGEEWVGQRSSSFTFALSNAVTGEQKGFINPIRNSPPTLSHDTTRTIKRTVNLSLGVEDTARINPVSDRVFISMIVGGVTYPLGRYLFADQTQQQWTSGYLSSAALVDEMFIIDQPMTMGYSSTNTVPVAIENLLADFDIDISIEQSGLAAAGSWPASTSRAKVLGDLCTQGGYFSPWFDNEGVLKIIRSFDPADHQVDIDLDEGRRVFRDSIANSNDLLTAPNRFVVISNGSPGTDLTTPAVGTYDIPASAPNSISNRGFIIADVRDIQVQGSDQAQVAAKTIGLASTVFERVSLSTPADPRHDSYDVVKWLDDQWLEISWSMTLAPGGAMNHVMRKAYS